MLLLKQKPDILGAFASSLCLVHCIATPFLFIVQTGSANFHHATPIWWKSIDYIFLIISFMAIYWSTKSTTNPWIKRMLWLSWLALSIVIFNEKLEMFPLAEGVIYIPAITLVILHLYNRKHCKCNTDNCCVNEG